ncbi:nucleotide-binding domain-containing protein [Nostoc sp.]|uniref:nucleotide-binding domain-containing protein n=1 Tax=Nostoc sp. TaxID=1180 RepID=UPI002FF893BB
MANCHKLFLKFNTLIAFKSKQKETLRVSRNAVRERIRRYFQNKQNGFFPKFHGQGSLMMNTIIEPLDGEFDIDDGIYFKVEVQPIQSVSTLHQWIWEAVDGHTTQKPIDKQTCVRLVYAGEYHLDLPIYYIIEGQTPYLAHKGKGFIKSDPREFIKWFNNKADNDGQLKRIVRYLKAWSDYRKGHLPSGLIFSILAANNIVFDERDDIAFYKTLLNIKSTLEQNFVCYRPTTPAYENLLKDYSKTNKDYFLGQLGSFIQSAEKALDEKTNQKDACEAWQRHFGEGRFPFESYANTEEFIENRFSIDIRYELKIDCLVSQQGFRPHSLIEMISSRLPLLRGKSLKFYIVDCNVPKPFQVKWKVRNVGEEATRRDQIRGQILNDSGNHQKNESSLFHGAHFVECYIIKDNICVARSRIDVPIKFPE